MKFLYSALKILNDCDVKYRQSTNKRLLVELTLIEVAQILQSDDDGVGRGPRKKLKNLFKNIMANTVQSEPAPQVAGTVRPVLSSTAQKNQSNNIATPSEPVKHTTPKLTITNLGMSFDSILNGRKGEKRETAMENKTTENQDFTLADLRLQWLSMCNRMESANMGGMAKRLKNIIPSITVYPNIELVVENEMLKTEINDIRKRLEVTMAKHLHNGNITISVRLAEQTEKRKILTPKENYEELLENSKAFKFLADKLKLELE